MNLFMPIFFVILAVAWSIMIYFTVNRTPRSFTRSKPNSTPSPTQIVCDMLAMRVDQILTHQEIKSNSYSGSFTLEFPFKDNRKIKIIVSSIFYEPFSGNFKIYTTAPDGSNPKPELLTAKAEETRLLNISITNLVKRSVLHHRAKLEADRQNSALDVLESMIL